MASNEMSCRGVFYYMLTAARYSYYYEVQTVLKKPISVCCCLSDCVCLESLATGQLNQLN